MKIAVARGTGAIGRHVAAVVRDAGHEPIVISRTTDIDLMNPDHVVNAIRGCAAVIDVTTTERRSTRGAVRFFSTITASLLDAERRAGVDHHVALSAVGARQINTGYYAGKAAQEEILTGSSTGWSVLRTTQMHESAIQIATRGLGPVVFVPKLVCKPVAAAEVAAELTRIALGSPQGIAPDLGGPKEERLIDMVRRFLASTGTKRAALQMTPSRAFNTRAATDAILPAPETRSGSQSFEDWLAAASASGLVARR